MKRFKKIVSLLLAVVMVLTMIPANAIIANAEETKVPTIAVESKSVMVGEELTVDVTIKNNPGIIGAELKVSYDEGLILTGATSGSAFSDLNLQKPAKYTSPCMFLWDGITSKVQDGTILTLTFDVAEDVKIGKAMKVNIEAGDFVDNDLQAVDVTAIHGEVRVFDFAPGDVNDDEKVNISDLLLIRKYIVGYESDINPNAANVNDDGKVSVMDVLYIRRYIAGGYGIKLLLPTIYICQHTMEATEYKAPTCTEAGHNAYWYCTECNKYFSDINGINEMTEKERILVAKGHTEVIIPAVEPEDPYKDQGWTEGSYCAECGMTLKEPEPYGPLEKDSYAITYHIANSDTYLAGLEIENPNPNTYTKQDGLVLEDLVVDGYKFLGWYDSSGEVRYTEFPVGTTGNKTLYAKWEKVEYKVTFDSPDIPIENVYYTVDTGVTLVNPSWFGYTFVGWSDDKGFIKSRIKPGTTGNITLHANWTSNRNKAVSFSKYADPIIIEDDNKGQFLFIYDIGRIENVPLSQIEYLGNSKGVTIDKTYTITDTISKENAEKISEALASATTTSSAWTLSKEWSQVYGQVEDSERTDIYTEERTDSEGNVVGGEYFVSNSTGGSSYMSTESGGSNSASSKVTTDVSKGINASYDASTEKYKSGTLKAENKTEIGAGISFPVKVAKVSADVKNTTTVSGELTSGRKDNTSFHVDGSVSSHVGTVNTDDSSSYYNVAANQSATWNSTSGYTSSYESSRETEISKAVSEQLRKKTSYSMEESLASGSKEEIAVGGTESRENEYSTSLKYVAGTATTEEKHIKLTADATGYYRIVEAGTVHVFAVVGYDIATASYYTYTYNVLDDERHEYLDYSLDNATFDDCENGLVNFKVPFDVFEYVSTVTGKTGGLKFDLNGGVIAFDSSKDESFDGTVVIPQYYSVDNGDGTKSAYKTTSISENTFKGNEEIKTVVLPVYITEIPDNAFEGCTNLETVIAYGVTEIGNNAFSGCTSLKSFSVDNKITALGSNAFYGVPEIQVMASDTDVADAAINSGAKKITLNISKISEAEDKTKNSYENKKVVVSSDTEYFALISDGSAYENLQVESYAKETFISNIKFVGNKDIPLKFESEKVTLARVTVEEAPGFALVLTNDNVNLELYGKIILSSSGENAVISKNVTLGEANEEVEGKLSLTGNYLVCGTMNNKSLIEFTKGELISIDETEFENMLKSSIVTFDPNEGTISEDEEQKVVYYGQTYGTLPTPEREYYTFLGWFTEVEGGTRITEDTLVELQVNHTLYAQWEKNVYVVEFDANEGTVEETSRIVPCGEAIGELPVPERTGYDFLGWFTEDGVEITAETVKYEADAIKAVAKWEAKAYTVNWNTGTGYTITVNRTESPYANASTGTLGKGDTVYYGDILSVTYAASTGYSLTKSGQTAITVTGNITADSIYAEASANSYTYNIVYKSVNGTNLGSTTATYKYGTTNTISAPAKTGYTTPGSQTVKWDSTSAKTITFTYGISSVADRQSLTSGTWWTSGNGGITYSVVAGYRNRTANSVQICIEWTQTIKVAAYGYNQYFYASMHHNGSNRGNTGTVQIASTSTWPYVSSSGPWHSGSVTVWSNWITVPLDTTNQTTVTVNCDWWTEGSSQKGSWSGKNITIPAY